MSYMWGIYDFGNKGDWQKYTQKEQTTTITQNNFINQYCFFQKIGHCNLTVEPALWHKHSSGYLILADAVIFNRRELQKKLDIPEEILFVDDIDSYLILRSYQRWGIKCLDHMIGDFAFAIWDPKQNYLFLARDPVGQRCFFYHISTSKVFYFANLVKPLFDICKIPKQLNDARIGEFLAYIPFANNSTLFKGIQRIEPGHYIIYDQTQSEQSLQKMYWSATNNSFKPITYTALDDYYAHFNELFKQVVAEMLHIDSQSACHLSGGLDSSSTTCMAAYLAQQENKSITAFGHIPSPGLYSQPKSNWNYDDSYYMQLVAKQYQNVSLVFIQDEDKKLFQYHQILDSWLEQPIINPANILWLMTCVEQANLIEIGTILTGSNGNFTISWGGVRNESVTFARMLRQQMGQYRQGFRDWQEGKRFYKPWGHLSAINKELASEIGLTANFRKNSLMKANQGVNDTRMLFFETNCINYVASLHTSIRCLYNVKHYDPTFDRRIIEFSLSIPHDIFAHNGQSRLLARKSMQGLMPKEICGRTTRGMQSADWYKKIERQKDEIASMLQVWKNNNVGNYLDIPHLSNELKKWNYTQIATSQGKQHIYYQQKYYNKFLRALNMGYFIQTHTR